MYGNKDEKKRRLKELAALIGRATRGMTQTALARALGVTRGTINKDLAALHEQGVLLAEDAEGRLFLAE